MDASPTAAPSAAAEIVAALLAFIAQDGCSDEAFDALALRLFGYQYANNKPFRRFCQGRGATPRQVRGWRDIPAVPINGFKDLTLSCQPPASCERVFMTSGTTRGDVKGRNHHPTLAVWNASFHGNFARRFMRGVPRIRMGILFPDESALPNSSLAHYLQYAVQEFGAPGSRHFIGPQGLDTAAVGEALAGAERTGEPCALLGASYSFVHLMDELQAQGRSFRLPPGSRILDTGGYKKQSRQLDFQEFYDALARTFGVPREQCINMYGMTELSSQFYDDGNAVVPSVKSGPHWIRSRIVDPLTGRDVPPGERGILVHCDLANFNSVTTILTEDVGVARGAGFLLLGRAEGAQAKGCSLAVEEFIQAARA
ncbi:long-chain fatty acid--CoA ligase [Ramlibacter sp.]|uniref:LuxE/PaaK family acyltransferase n=1 Tax=Ramlibacter sp. TaxID=1917967 RepID=UPI002B973277|nr:long-chain fatty acid--CoA ligase [Ramlibacter sp.]HWI84378.1 long-chain fatty acid--CoA ligase [Ramlibacter sp.]